MKILIALPCSGISKSESEISKWLTGLHNLELRTIYKIEAALGEEVIEGINIGNENV